MAEACFRCGTTEADTYRFCSARKSFVCINCERACEHFSSKLLSNGTNCKLTLPPKHSYRFLTLTKDVEKAKEQYTGKTDEELKTGFKLLEERYRHVDKPEVRATIRARLAAIEERLEDRRMTSGE